MLLKDINSDLTALKIKYKTSKLVAIITNRGVHALVFYRMANSLYQLRIPLFPLILTRIIQIIYSIDIDYRAKLEGGIIIIHGIGLVIGAGSIVRKNTIIYHQVTLGIKGTSINDGLPIVEEGCLLGAGSKLLGPITIGKHSIIGANVVITNDVAESSIVRVATCQIKKIKN